MSAATNQLVKENPKGKGLNGHAKQNSQQKYRGQGDTISDNMAEVKSTGEKRSESIIEDIEATTQRVGEIYVEAQESGNLPDFVPHEFLGNLAVLSEDDHLYRWCSGVGLGIKAIRESKDKTLILLSLLLQSEALQEGDSIAVDSIKSVITPSARKIVDSDIDIGIEGLVDSGAIAFVDNVERSHIKMVEPEAA